MRSAVLDLNGAPSIAAEKTGMLPAWPYGSSSHITSPESKIGVVFKTTSVFRNISRTFAAVWTLNSQTRIAATLEATSETGSSSMVWSTMNLGSRMPKRHLFR
ncbi:hypothetical protein TNCV_1241421 [Trichonephila clavipes]|uniref:Uncharacterized protein n=1 Tax=Trichonephila clavipes TaxID=2585209 RepID=A0A8X6WE05_TRICX|nr:hypothetical protein TNCV_1241421 [Trichonephila clavipes]